MEHNTTDIKLSNLIRAWVRENYVGVRVTELHDGSGYFYPTILASRDYKIGMICDEHEMLINDGRPCIFIYTNVEAAYSRDPLHPLDEHSYIYAHDPNIFTKLKGYLDWRLRERRTSAV